MERRNFIKATSLAAAGTFTGFHSSLKAFYPRTDKVRVAVMGVNSRGAYHAEMFSRIPGVEVAYICDVEDSAIKNGMDALKEAKNKVTVERDIRKLVEKNDFDALIIAAPDHWHAPATLMAVQNGKHVYVEKPAGHNPRESELLIEAARKYDRLIQVGSQRRSFPTLIEAVNEVKSGIIGNTYFAKSWYANERGSIGKGKIVAVPKGLDYELWQGPAPRKPYRDNLIHYNWHWFWNWGTGEVCNNGNHELDCCRWFLDVDFPTKVTSAGGRYAFKDDWETTDTQIAAYEFGNNKSISWEGRSCNPYPQENSTRGFIIYGDKGTLVNTGGGEYRIYNKENELIKEITSDLAVDPTNTVAGSGDSDRYHFNNFINSIRGEAKLTAPIDDAHKSVVLCHLANIAQRSGSVLHCNAHNGHIIDNKAAVLLWTREYEKGWEMEV